MTSPDLSPFTEFMNKEAAGQTKPGTKVDVMRSDVVHDSIVRQANRFSKSVGHWTLSTFGESDRRTTTQCRT